MIRLEQPEIERLPNAQPQLVHDVAAVRDPLEPAYRITAQHCRLPLVDPEYHANGVAPRRLNDRINLRRVETALAIVGLEPQHVTW